MEILSPNIKNNKQGFVLLVALFLIVVASFLVVIIHQNRQTTAAGATYRYNDILRAQERADLAIDLGLNEWELNADPKNNFTANAIALEQSPVNGGFIDIYFDGAPNFSDNIVTIRTVGKFNQLKRTSTLTFKFTPEKKMGLIRPTTASTQFDPRRIGLEELGWAVTVFDEATVTVAELDLMDIVYLPNQVGNTLVAAITDTKAAIATENSGHWYHLGFCTNNNSVTMTHRYSDFRAGCSPYCNGYSGRHTFHDVNKSFAYQWDTTLVANVSVQMGLYSGGTGNVYTHIPLLPAGGTRRDNLGRTPKARIGFPIVINDTQLWSDLTTDGKNIINHYLGIGANCTPPCTRKIDIISQGDPFAQQ